MSLLLYATIISLGLIFTVSLVVILLSLIYFLSSSIKTASIQNVYKTRVSLAIETIPVTLYCRKLYLTGSSNQSYIECGTIVGFSRMRNEHLAHLLISPPKKVEEYLKEKDKDGYKIPPKSFWLNLTSTKNKEALHDLININYVVIVPKPYDIFAFIPPLVKYFLPKRVILFTDSQIANPNKELMGDLWLKGVNIDMLNANYWFIPTDKITKHTFAMVIRSDAYVYELIESYHKLGEIAREIGKTNKDIVESLLKTKTTHIMTTTGEGVR